MPTMLHSVPFTLAATPTRVSIAVVLLCPLSPRTTRGISCMDARRFVRDGAGAACVPNGMWIFTRQQARDEGLVAKARGIAVAKGIDVSVLEYVNQTACVSVP